MMRMAKRNKTNFNRSTYIQAQTIKDRLAGGVFFLFHTVQERESGRMYVCVGGEFETVNGFRARSCLELKLKVT